MYLYIYTSLYIERETNMITIKTNVETFSDYGF